MQNKVCELLGISYPIIQGGMGNISSGVLSGAISEANGLGTLGVGTVTPKEVEEEIIKLKSITSKPFAINIPITVSPFVKDILSLIKKYEIKIVSLSAGDPKPLIPILHELGCIVMVVVGTEEQAVKAEQKGADIIVVEGYEAAGINSPNELTTFTLVPQVVQSVSVPVIAAGGVADGKGLAAALALGAFGVQMGTRFIATVEAPFSENYKKMVVQSNGTDTRIVGRKVGRVRRVLTSSYISKLLEKEGTGITLEEFNTLTSEKYHKIGALSGNFEEGYVNGGQVVGRIHEIVPVKDLLLTMMKEAKEQVTMVNNLLG